MKTSKPGQKFIGSILIGCFACAPLMQSALAASTNLANVPMAVSNSVTPNILAILDNSQSMDGYMVGTLVSGNDPTTRGNIGRLAMRNAVTNYRTVFNWGLMSFAIGSPGLYNTWVYLMGDNNGMVFTSDCVGYVAGVLNGAPLTPGVSASNPSATYPGGRRCVGNPQPFTGGEYVTFDMSSDDSNIVDALYDPGAYASLWGLSSGGTSYYTYGSHNTGAGASWASGAFTSYYGNWGFTPTDAGFLPSNPGVAPYPTVTRQLYLPRGWGYYANITGAGTLNEPVQVDSTTHYNKLMTLMGNETNGNTGEIKNAAVYTPTTGTLNSAKTYFSGNTSPIQYACQQNFVMLVTDGLPTGTTSGAMYNPPPNTTNSCVWNTTTNSCTSGSFGAAATDAIAAVRALRTTPNAISSTAKDGTGVVTGKFDVQTYVVALASTLGSNAQNMAVMNAMAYAGGGLPTALLATDAASFASAMLKITDDVTAKAGASAAVSVANAHPTSANHVLYANSYNSGTWTGDLNAFSIDLTTGLPGSTSAWGAGSAQAQLDLVNAGTRMIATSTDAAGSIGGIQFQPTTAGTATTLSAAQQTLLNTSGLTDGAAVVAYLRGDRTGETAGTYRMRAHLLGDIINAEPVIVEAPGYNYADAGYAAFKGGTSASRTSMLYQGANDGMLHAFNAASGAEAWAYIPNLVMAGLNNLSSKTLFTHKYLVDGTPVSGDVDFGNTQVQSAMDWRTILVGGLNKGGRGYYALDVTCPDKQSGACTTAIAGEADVAAKVLWEFPNSITNATQRNSASLNTGYSFGKPVIVKTKAAGWVVLVTSGYNNGTNAGDSGGDGLGHLFVLNAKTGDLIADIPTTGCTTTPTSSPCGLAQIAAYIPGNYTVDNTTDFVYGGDLMGNVWRFNLSTASSAGWSVSKFATLKDVVGATQPITTPPLLTTIAGKRFVFVGTGEYLGSTDVTTTQHQTIYGLVDDTVHTLPDPLRPTLQAQTFTVSGANVTGTSNTMTYNYPTLNGWYGDFAFTGERLNTAPKQANGVLTFSTNIPSATPCVPGGSGLFYTLNANSGGMVSGATYAAISLGQFLGSAPTIYQLPSGTIIGLVHLSGTPVGGVPFYAGTVTTAAAALTRRFSWRELFN